MAVRDFIPTTAGGQFDTAAVQLTNKLGSSTVKYGIYMYDLARANAASTSADLALTNVIAVTTAGLAKELVIAQDVITDGSRGYYCTAGGTAYRTKCLVNGNSTNIAAGDFLKATNAQAYATKSTLGTDACFAIALEAATTDSAVIEVLFFGRAIVGSLGVVGVLSSAAELDQYMLTYTITDISSESSYYIAAPSAGNIVKIYTTTDTAILTADATLTFSIGGVAVTSGVVTMPVAGAAAGNVASATPSAANAITAGAALKAVASGGGSAGTGPRVNVVIVIQRTS